MHRNRRCLRRRSGASDPQRQRVLKSIKIDPKLADPTEVEMLEDLISAAHADAKTQTRQLHRKRNEKTPPAG